jgi:hypothetical protein
MREMKKREFENFLTLPSNHSQAFECDTIILAENLSEQPFENTFAQSANRSADGESQASGSKGPRAFLGRK